MNIIFYFSVTNGKQTLTVFPRNKGNFNAPIEPILESLIHFSDQEIYELRGRDVVKNNLTETRYAHLTFNYLISRFLPITILKLP